MPDVRGGTGLRFETAGVGLGISNVLRAPSVPAVQRAADAPRSSFVRTALAVAAESGRAQFQRMSALCAERRCIARGGALFRSGGRFVALYEVQTGFFKSCLVDQSGRSQVTGFQMSGELLGLDGIGTEYHCVDAIALEDAMVCVIPFVALNELLKDSSDLHRQFHKAMSREIVRDQAMMLTLGTMPAEGRIAAFVLDLSQRLFERGFSSSALVLRMSREEIGSFLGLQIETVSRGFSKLHLDGVLEIRNRDVHVLDPVALRRLAQGAPRTAGASLHAAL